MTGLDGVNPAEEVILFDFCEFLLGTQRFCLRDSEVSLVKTFQILSGIFRNFSRIFQNFLAFSGSFLYEILGGCRSA